ncbi:MAG: DNA-binding protein [Synergistales bacterium]|nr:DNA-binding protein [Synergistales bacterium]
MSNESYRSCRDTLTYALRLNDGESFFPALKGFLEKEQIASAAIISAVGMLRDVTIGWFSGTEYKKHTFREGMEVLQISGTTSIKEDGEPFFHHHCTLADGTHAAYGGHLFEGTVHNTMELLFLVPQGMEFHRRLLVEGEQPRFCPIPKEK